MNPSTGTTDRLFSAASRWIRLGYDWAPKLRCLPFVRDASSLKACEPGSAKVLVEVPVVEERLRSPPEPIDTKSAGTESLRLFRH